MEEKLNENENGIELSEEELAQIEREENYQQAIRLFNSIDCMTLTYQKIEMLQKLADDFNEMDGYQDSEDLMRECLEIKKKTEVDLKKSAYERAKEKKDTSKTPDEYNKAIEALSRVNGFQDAEQLVEECKREGTALIKRKRRNSILLSLAILAVFVLLIAYSHTSYAKYYYANFSMATKAYPSAITRYLELRDFKDSESRYIQSYYLMGKQLVKNKNYDEAARAFGRVETYKDSEKLKVETEKKELVKAQIGDKVTFGNCEWKVLDKKDDQALLLRNENLSTMPYHNTIEAVTWEKSFIRQWLNSRFLKEAFSNLEQKEIILSDLKNENNAVYGTTGGENTKDYVYLLSIREARKYLPNVAGIKSNAWLRSPGNNPTAAAFYSADGKVMDYGYEATDVAIMVRPVITVKVES